MLKDNTSIIGDALKQSLNEYLIDHYIPEDSLIENLKISRAPKKRSYSYHDDIRAEYAQTPDVSGIDALLEDTFSDTLFKMIWMKRIDEVKMYQEAFISKQHFSKMRSDSNYQPKRKTVLLLCVAMKLTIDESVKLMKSAGYAFNHASKFELIIKYFIEQRIYDFHTIDSILIEYDQETLRKYDT